ncbi:aminoacyltransferase [Patescibacteria group bacterium]|nr:aminoacyltransferase [Patescibacteria group bacterium]MCL5091213.1 aminoacyltransferase [Patescibacteria group bacterium]
MTIKIVDNTDIHRYNRLARHPLQSWQWGEARRATGVEVLRLTTGTDVFQLSLHPLPYLGWKVGYLPRSVFPTQPVVAFLQDYAKKNRVIFIKIEPYAFRSRLTIGDLQLRPSPHPLFPDWTQILDISPNEETLLKRFKPKTRYNIRLAQKKGVTVKEESNDRGFAIFSDLYFATCRRQRYFGHTPRYHRIVWDGLKPDIAHILIAYYHDEPLAAYQLWKFKDRFYYVYGGSSDKYRNLMATNLLMWEAIKLGKRLGAGTLDMWGSLAPHYDQGDPWAGFTRFKAGYGTEFVRTVGSYDLVINPLLYIFYNLVDKLRHTYLGFVK